MNRYRNLATSLRTMMSEGSWTKRILAGVLFVLLLVPVKVLAGLTEYALILALIAIIAIAALKVLPPGSAVVLQQLQTTIQTAQTAHTSGDKQHELSSLSQAIGLTQAVIGMTASCQNCDEVRTDLQAIIGLASKLRYRLVKGGACNPDGVVSASEQCDPLADPTGCPVTSLPMFCNDQCLCEAITTCPTGQTNCSGACVDLTADDNNCGSCGNVCPSTAPACIASVCTVP
jgi:Flp pilus assembly pilin Flp